MRKQYNQFSRDTPLQTGIFVDRGEGDSEFLGKLKLWLDNSSPVIYLLMIQF